MLYEAGKGCIKQQQKHGILCAQCTLCQMRHTTLRMLPHAIPTSCGIQKKSKTYVSQTKPKWLIAFARELGDVVSRVLATWHL